jgi:hypothetical protein
LGEVAPAFSAAHLPKGLVRIRYYGWMGNLRRSACATLCRTQLEAAPEPVADALSTVRTCPICGGPVVVVETILPRHFPRQKRGRKRELNSS